MRKSRKILVAVTVGWLGLRTGVAQQGGGIVAAPKLPSPPPPSSAKPPATANPQVKLAPGAKEVAEAARKAGLDAVSAADKHDFLAASRAYRRAAQLQPKEDAWSNALTDLKDRQHAWDAANGALIGERWNEAELALHSYLVRWPSDRDARNEMQRVLIAEKKWGEATTRLVATITSESGFMAPSQFALQVNSDLRGLIFRAERDGGADAVIEVLRTAKLTDELERKLRENQRWVDLIDVYAEQERNQPFSDALARYARESLLLRRKEIALQAWEKELASSRNSFASQKTLDDIVDVYLADRRFEDARRVTRLYSRTYPPMQQLAEKLAKLGEEKESLATDRSSGVYEKLGDYYAGAERWSDAARMYFNADGAYISLRGPKFKHFVEQLTAKNNYDAVWDAYRSVYAGQEWKPAELSTPGSEVAKAAWRGAIRVKPLFRLGTLGSTVSGLDCLVLSQNPALLRWDQTIEVADFASRKPDDPTCGNGEYLVVKYEGRNVLTPLQWLQFEIAPLSAFLRPLPTEKTEVAIEFSLVGGRNTYSGQSAPGQEPPLTELALGNADRGRNLAGSPNYSGDPDLRDMAQGVFQRLLNTSVRRSGPAEPYELFLRQNSSVNAFSSAAGKVYVDSGIFPYLEKEPGLWAAVVSHEIGHCVGQDHYHAYMRLYELQRQKAFWQWRASLGDKAAPWALLGLKIGGDILNKKLTRDEESEADRKGLMMMAEAGYHPDFILSLFDRMKGTTGDQSKLTAFFGADHPRWDTRQQRTMKEMNSALAIFEKRWSDPAKSPGGMPPPMFVLSDPEVTVNKQQKTVHVSVPYDIRHAAGSADTVKVVFFDKGKPVASADPEFQTKDGSLGIEQDVVVSGDRLSAVAEITIPAAIAGKNRKLQARAVLLTDGKIKRETRAVVVDFPKP